MSFEKIGQARDPEKLKFRKKLKMIFLGFAKNSKKGVKRGHFSKSSWKGI